MAEKYIYKDDSMLEEIIEVEKKLNNRNGIEKRLLDNKGYSICFNENAIRVSNRSGKVDVTIIDSMGAFINKLNEDDRKDEIIGENYYRGHSNCNYLIQPLLYRDSNKKILDEEEKIIRDIISKNPDFFKDDSSILEKIVRLQHHGFPTRLLDLTDNPLVALYFACKSSEGNGEVIRFYINNNDIKYTDSDAVTILANLSKVNKDFSIKSYDVCKSKTSYELNLELKYNIRYLLQEYMKNDKKIILEEFYNEELIAWFKERYSEEDFKKDIRKMEGIDGRVIEFNSNEEYYIIKKIQREMEKNIKISCIFRDGEEQIIKRLVHFIRDDRSYFENRIVLEDLKNRVVCVKPSRYIKRMKNQCGVFMMFGMDKVKSKCAVTTQNIDKKIYIIPKGRKKEIINQLDRMNINEATIMGDLDSIIKCKLSSVE